jgi:hypothetical protein
LTDREAIRASIKSLVVDGNVLLGAELVMSSPKGEREKFARAILKTKEAVWPGGATTDVEVIFKQLLKTPDFKTEYQAWYSPALRVVQQLLPDRYDEFRELYKPARRKEIDAENYGVADFIAGIRIVRGFNNEEVFSSRSAALGKFGHQIAIIQTAEGRLDSALTDIGRTCVRKF